MIDINRVAIIGAGPAGICAARHLYHNKYTNKKFDIVIYERQDQIGGLWIYNKTKKNHLDDSFISPVYRHLKTNLPIQLMQFEDFPFETESELSFWCHADFRKYIEDYANHFNVSQFVQFNTEVTAVSPHIDSNKEVSEDGFDRFIKWKVESKDLKSGNSNIEEFDAVVLCNGVFSTPYYAPIENLKYFNGEISHSKYYDDPLHYKDKIVLVYGQAASAMDIVTHIYKIAKEVHFLKRSKGAFKPKHPENVYERPDIRRVNENGEIEFTDDSRLNADILLFCTGYIRKYPLSSDCKINIKEDGQVVTPVYKHMFHAIYPSLVFLSLAAFTGTCIFYDRQCSYLTTIFTQHKQLPSKQEMLDDTNNEKLEKDAAGKSYRRFHFMALDTFRYANIYADLSGEEPYPEGKRKIFMNTVYHLIHDFYNFSELHNR